MRIRSLKWNGTEQAAIAASQGLVPMAVVNAASGQSWSLDVLALLVQGQLEEIGEWYRLNGEKDSLLKLQAIPYESCERAPLYRLPRKILGVGANYVEVASQLNVSCEEEPVTFMKPDTALIGPGDPIVVPAQSSRTTAEAELAVVIGKRCRGVSEQEAAGVIAGYTSALDMTAADIHSRNPRFIARAKSFDTFLSLGSELVTPDELGDLSGLEVATILNGDIATRNVVGNMRFNPLFQVSFFSQVMTLLPGDVILTGTPGPVVIREGDRVECRITGFEPLTNPVVQG